jgi:hypothetical protein
VQIIRPLALGDVLDRRHGARWLAGGVTKNGHVDIHPGQRALLPETPKVRGQRLVAADLGLDLGQDPRHSILGVEVVDGHGFQFCFGIHSLFGDTAT